MSQIKLKKKRKNTIIDKLLSIAIIIVFLFIGIYIISSLISMNTKSSQLRQAQLKLKEVQEENESLKSSIKKLEDPDYVQSYARGEYMFSKSGEKVFYLPSSNDSNDTDKNEENKENTDGQ